MQTIFLFPPPLPLLVLCRSAPVTSSHSNVVIFVDEWTGDFRELVSLLYGELQKAKEEQKDDKRSAASNARGRQLTPTFIEAVLRDVLNDPGAKPGERAVTNPRGGLTDVGRHTGRGGQAGH